MLQIDAVNEKGERLDGFNFIHKAPVSIGTDDWRLVRQVFRPRTPVQSLRLQLCARGVNGYTLDDTGTQPQNDVAGTRLVGRCKPHRAGEYRGGAGCAVLELSATRREMRVCIWRMLISASAGWAKTSSRPPSSIRVRRQSTACAGGTTLALSIHGPTWWPSPRGAGRQFAWPIRSLRGRPALSPRSPSSKRVAESGKAPCWRKAR